MRPEGFRRARRPVREAGAVPGYRRGVPPSYSLSLTFLRNSGQLFWYLPIEVIERYESVL